MALSRVIRVGDGSTLQFVVDFALGYINETDVTCRVGDEADGLGDPIYRNVTFLSPTLVQIDGAAPGNGVNVVFDRTVDKESLVTDFSNGDILDEDNLDQVLEQIMMAVHEVLDGRFGTFDADLDMGGFQVTNLGTPTEDTDAATKEYVDDKLDNLDAEVAAAAASASAAASSASAAAASVTAAASEASDAADSAVDAAASAALAASFVSAPYATRALAEAANIPSQVTFIQVEHGGEVLAYIRDASGTALTTADGGNWSPAYEKTVMHYGAMGDGSTDDSADIQTALDDAANDTIIFNDGHSFVVNTGLLVEDQNIVIKGYGAYLIQGAHVIPLTLRSSYNAETTLTAIHNDATYDFSDGDGVNTPVARLEAAGHPFAVGDVVKVTSDTQFVQAGSANFRWGEAGRVVATSADSVYLSRRFLTELGSYTTLRAARMRQFKIEVHGLAFDTVAAGDAGGWNTHMLKLEGLVAPRLRDLYFVKGWGIAVQSQGCVEVDAHGITGGNLKHHPSTGGYAYMVNDVSGWFNSWSNIICERTRHAYTTNINSTGALGDMRYYGQTVGSTVKDSVASDTYGSSFDTHHDAAFITFDNCKAVGSMRGKDAVGSGFQIRGTDVSVLNCSALGVKWGLQVLQQYATDATKNAIIRNFECNSTFAAITAYGISTNLITNVKIYGLVASNTDHDHIVALTNADLEVHDATLTMTNTLTAVYPFTLGLNATVRARGVHFRHDGLTGTTPSVYLFELTDDTADARCWNIRVNGVWRGLFEMHGNDATGISFDPVVADSDPGAGGMLGTLGANAVAGVDFYQDYAQSNAFRYRQLTYAGGNNTLDYAYRSAPIIYYRIQCTSASNITAIPAGLFIGQLLMINNRDNSSGNLVIVRDTSGTPNLRVRAGNLTISAGQSAWLWWDGAAWREA